MPIRKKNFLCGILILLVFSNCNTSIRRIKLNADRYHGKKISVRGEVISSLDLHDINCFTIKNKSGNLLIVTDNLLPLKKDKIRVKGTVEKAYPYKGKNLLVLIEKKMKLQKPQKSKNIKRKIF